MRGTPISSGTIVESRGAFRMASVTSECVTGVISPSSVVSVVRGPVRRVGR